MASLKIEGRLKTPEYVANITRHYRAAIDAAWSGEPPTFRDEDVREMELSFSRGFSHGFLDGIDHKVLVRGDHAKKRGIFLGEVTSIAGARIRLNLAAPVKCGDGVVFVGDDESGIPEQGGRVYEVSQVRRPKAGGPRAEPLEIAAGPVELSFGRHDLDPRQMRPGQRACQQAQAQRAGSHTDGPTSISR